MHKIKLIFSKQNRSYFIAIIVILMFSIASISTIIWIDSRKIQPLTNDTVWFETHFVNSFFSPLSEKQKNSINNSVSIVSNVAQDEGVTVTLQSACGNGYSTYFKMNVEISEGMDPNAVWHFEESCLKSNDNNRYPVTASGPSYMLDGTLTGNHCSILVNPVLSSYSVNRWGFESGLIHILQLKNLFTTDENGQKTCIKGQWEFQILFPDENKTMELIQDPVLVKTGNAKNYFEANVNSFVMTELTAYCDYEITPNSTEQIMGIRPLVIMQDGSTFAMVSRRGSSVCYEFTFPRPVSLDEVAFVKLTDEKVLPIIAK